MKILPKNSSLPPSASLSVVHTIQEVWVWFAHSSRNAWHYDKSLRYLSKSIGLTRRVAADVVERQRVQGTTWWLAQVPALAICSDEMTVVVVDVNQPERVVDPLIGASMAPTVSPMARAPRCVSSSSHALLMETGDMVATREEVTVYKSYSEGGAYRLSWRPLTHGPKTTALDLDEVRAQLDLNLNRGTLGIQYHRVDEGLRISELHSASPLAASGGRRGDVIQEFESEEGVRMRPTTALEHLRPGRVWRCRISREGDPVEVEFQVAQYRDLLGEMDRGA